MKVNKLYILMVTIIVSVALFFTGCSSDTTNQVVNEKKEEKLHPDQLIPVDAPFSDEVKKVFRNYNLVPVVVNGINITDEILKHAMTDYSLVKTPEEKFANKESIKIWANKKGDEVYFWSRTIGTTFPDKADFFQEPLKFERFYKDIDFETERILIVEWKE